MYSELSDLEINKRVAHTLGYTVQGRGWISCADGIYDYIAESADPDSYRSALPDYCNNWAEAGPIIQSNNITLIFETGDNPCALSNVRTGQCFEVEFSHCFQGPNILRNAMTVFLMMEEVK